MLVEIQDRVRAGEEFLDPFETDDILDCTFIVNRRSSDDKYPYWMKPVCVACGSEEQGPIGHSDLKKILRIVKR